MPSSYTENYNLSQWELTDKIQMSDFNADNAKIDAALKAEAEAREALAARSGSCSVRTFSYTGTGTYGANNPTRITFPKMPAAYIVLGSALLIGVGGAERACLSYSVAGYGHTGSVDVSWSGNTLSIVSADADRQMNDPITYMVIAFYTAD